MPVKEASSEETPYGRYIGFLVLSGECTLTVEDQERPLRAWDYFHCPSDTRHICEGDARPGEAYADWPGEYEPLRLPWPLE